MAAFMKRSTLEIVGRPDKQTTPGALIANREEVYKYGRKNVVCVNCHVSLFQNFTSLLNSRATS